MANIKKTLSSKVDANGYAQILMRVRAGRSLSLRLKTNVFVPIDYWNEKKEDVRIPRVIETKLAKELQESRDKLDTFEKRTLKLIELYGEKTDKALIENTLLLLKDYDGTITKDVLDGLHQQQETEKEKHQKTKTVFSYCTEYLNIKKFSLGREKHYKVVFRTMARFQLYCQYIKRNDFDWNINTTSKDDVLLFFDYLTKEHIYRTKLVKVINDDKVNEIYPDGYDKKHKSPRIEQKGENRLIDIKKAVRAFWRWLVENGYTTNNPTDKIKIGSQTFGTPFYLSLEERNKLASFDLHEQPALEIQRDIFVFQCCVGCRVADLMRFNQDNLVNNRLVYVPHKTKDEAQAFEVRVPLNPLAINLIKKYQGKDKKGRLFPFISSDKYNDNIKKILKVCGIDRKVSIRNPKTGENEMKPLYEVASSHMARRTFIGTLYKVVTDPNLIGRMSGHVEGSKAFIRYRDIDDEMLDDVINKVN